MHRQAHAPYAFTRAPRCGARTRSGTACHPPAVRGKKRCRMHGGAAGSGAPKGNRNAFKHGARSKEMQELAALLNTYHAELHPKDSTL